MRQLSISLLIVLMNSCNESSESNEFRIKGTAADVMLVYNAFPGHNIASTIDHRLEYYITQFGDSTAFEQFFDTTVESVRNNGIKTYLDSLLNK